MVNVRGQRTPGTLYIFRELPSLPPPSSSKGVGLVRRTQLSLLRCEVQERGTLVHHVHSPIPRKREGLPFASGRAGFRPAQCWFCGPRQVHWEPLLPQPGY